MGRVMEDFVRSVRACALMLLAAGLVVASSGCRGPEKGGEAPADGGVSAEAPAPGAFVALHNARVEGLGRIKARIVASIDGHDAEGRALREQAEGNLMLIQPDRAAVLLGKLGKTGLVLGTDGERYWWIDSVSADEPVALVGSVALATPERTAMLGLPVHPGEVTRLLGIAPIDPDAEVESSVSEGGGHFGLHVPSAWGTTTYWYDRETMRPVFVELLDGSGERVGYSALEQYDNVFVEGRGDLFPAIPTRMTVYGRAFDGSVRLTLYDASNTSFPTAAFSLEGLLRRYRVERVGDLDATEPRAGVEAGLEGGGGS